MWFRNLQLYRLGGPFDVSPEVFAEQLAADVFKGCSSMDMLTHGWAPPLGRHGQQLVHAAGGYQMICLRKEETFDEALFAEKVATFEWLWTKQRDHYSEAVIGDAVEISEELVWKYGDAIRQAPKLES